MQQKGRKSERDVKDESTPKSEQELAKRQSNLKEIFLCSNATPVRSRDSGYGCCYCAHTFPTISEIKAHSLNDHDETTKMAFVKNLTKSTIFQIDISALKCTICEEKLEDIEELLTHLKKIHKKNTHTSAKMHKSYLPIRNKDKETAHTEPDSLICKFCDESFKSNSTLWRHSRRYHKKDSFKCDTCSKQFFSKEQLKRHIKIHTGQKDFKCTLCTTSFSRKDALNVHLRIHANDRKFKCLTCGEGFIYNRSLKSHKKTIHGEEI